MLKRVLASVVGAAVLQDDKKGYSPDSYSTGNKNEGNEIVRHSRKQVLSTRHASYLDIRIIPVFS